MQATTKSDHQTLMQTAREEVAQAQKAAIHAGREEAAALLQQERDTEQGRAAG